MFLFGFAFPIWAERVNDTPDPRDSEHLRVIAQQYAWNIHYPGADGRFGDTKVNLVDEQDNPIGLDRSSEFGADDFYSGETAKLIVEQMKESDGLITMEDLNSYEAVWREPLRSNWRNYEVISAPPPSSGGFAIIQLLKMKDYLDHFFSGLEHNSAQYIHLVAEMEKRVFADRAEYLGDPDFFDVPLEILTSKKYAEKRFKDFKWDRLSESEKISHGNIKDRDSRETTHFSVMGSDGMAVSFTTTFVAYSLGSASPFRFKS